MNISITTLLRPAEMIPTQRPHSLPAQIEKAAISCATPTISTIHPHVFRLLKT